MKKHYAIFIALFLAMLVIPTLCVFAGQDREFSDNENRVLQTAPKLTLDSVLDGSFQEKLTDYISDQFPARDTWTQLGTEIKKLLGYKDIGGAYLGDDGYYMEKLTPSDIDEDNFKKNLALVEDFAETNKGIKTTLLLIPAAGTVLEDKLPSGAVMYDERALYSEAVSALPDVSVPDLYPALADAAETEQVYYRTDHHWTWFGARAAYELLLPDGKYSTEPELFSDSFLGTTYSKTLDPAAEPDSVYISAVSESIVVTADGNDIPLYDTSASDEKDKYKVFFGGNYGEALISGGCDNGKTLLLIKDSYANSLAPFLTADYETIIMLDLRYYMGSAQQLIADEGVDEILFVQEASSFANDKNLVKLGF